MLFSYDQWAVDGYRIPYDGWNRWSNWAIKAGWEFLCWLVHIVQMAVIIGYSFSSLIVPTLFSHLILHCYGYICLIQYFTPFEIVWTCNFLLYTLLVYVSLRNLKKNLVWRRNSSYCLAIGSLICQLKLLTKTFNVKNTNFIILTVIFTNIFWLRNLWNKWTLIIGCSRNH